MNEARYVLHFNMANVKQNSLTPGQAFLKKVIIGIFVLFLILLLFKGKELLKELGIPVIVLLIGLGVWFMTHKKELVADPVEIRFYDTEMVVYKPKYAQTETRVIEEYKTFPYDRVKECRYSSSSEMLMICGEGHLLQYRYKSDGTKDETPYKEMDLESLSDHLWLHFALDDDVPGKIEKYSPIRVERTGKFK